MSNTIKLKKYEDIINEEVASEAITPGQLVEVKSDGEIQKHATAGGDTPRLFALEDELQGNTIEDDYADQDQVFVWAAQSGEEVLASIESDEDPAVGTQLYSNGNGNLTATSAGDAVKIAEVIGSKEIDGSSNHRVPVRII